MGHLGVPLGLDPEAQVPEPAPQEPVADQAVELGEVGRGLVVGGDDQDRPRQARERLQPFAAIGDLRAMPAGDVHRGPVVEPDQVDQPFGDPEVGLLGVGPQGEPGPQDLGAGVGRPDRERRPGGPMGGVDVEEPAHQLDRVRPDRVVEDQERFRPQLRPGGVGQVEDRVRLGRDGDPVPLEQAHARHGRPLGAVPEDDDLPADLDDGRDGRLGLDLADPQAEPDQPDRGDQDGRSRRHRPAGARWPAAEDDPRPPPGSPRRPGPRPEAGLGAVAGRVEEDRVQVGQGRAARLAAARWSAIAPRAGPRGRDWRNSSRRSAGGHRSKSVAPVGWLTRERPKGRIVL